MKKGIFPLLYVNDNIKIIEKYFSRRHSVYKVEIQSENKTPAVLKVYEGEKATVLCRTERENLERLHRLDLRVPQVLAWEEKALLMEFLPGMTVSRLAENLDAGSWIEKMAYWFARLHSVENASSCMLKGDANLRNFIFSGGEIFGIDFEEMGFGDFRQDLSEVCFFLLTDYPPLTPEKDHMVRRFLKAYAKHAGKSIDDMDKFILKSRSNARIRRATRGRDTGTVLRLSHFRL